MIVIIKHMKLLLNPLSRVHLVGIFCCVALLMTGYEFMKELFFRGKLSIWESHALTIMLTSVLATAAAFLVRKRIAGEAEVRIAATAFEAQDGIMISDDNGVILRVNHAFTMITGYTADEAVGQTMSLLRSGRHDDVFYAEIWASIRNDGVWNGEIWNRRKNGEIYPERLSITAVKMNKGKIIHYVYTMHDITKRKQNEEQIHALAFYDTLTQLPNRRLMNDRLKQAMASSKRSRRYGALMFMDMDNFKVLNDTHGHGTGDLMLIEVANRLTSCLRETDTVSRFGGDEFVAIFNELNEDKNKSIELASIIAEKIRSVLAKPYVLKVPFGEETDAVIEHNSAASIGVVLFISQEASSEDIIKWADTAMYQAKKTGRNQFNFYDP